MQDLQEVILVEPQIYFLPSSPLPKNEIHGRIFEQHEYNFSEGEGKEMSMFLATIKYLWYILDPVEPEQKKYSSSLESVFEICINLHSSAILSSRGEFVLY